MVLSGRIVPKTELLGQLASMTTLYIAVFDEDSPAEVPYLSRRLDLTRPIDRDGIEFTASDAVWTPLYLPSHPLRRLMIKVRADRDHRPGPDEAGDIIGVAKGLVPGQSAIHLVLEKELE